MDFDRLPDDICLEILLQLPFDERVRLARVSKRFQQMSEMAVSRTTMIDLTADMFQDANSEAIRQLLELCAGSLRQVACNFTKNIRIKILSKFYCPRLEELRLFRVLVKGIDLRNLLCNSPRLRSLKWDWPNDTFPSGVAYEQLESVHFSRCTVGFFESLANSCRNLKHVVLIKLTNESEQWEQALNRIFTITPTLETLDVEEQWNELRIDQMENLWGLAELRSLRLCCRDINDDTMITITTSFGYLERLRLQSHSRSQQKVSSRGMVALSSLQHLRELELVQYPYGQFDADVDEAVKRLAEYGRLETVHLSDLFSQTTMRAFVNCCPMLRLLRVRDVEGINGIDASDAAKEFVESLAGFPQKNLEISLQGHPNPRLSWYEMEVKEALARVNATASGRSISIKCLMYIHAIRTEEALVRPPTPDSDEEEEDNAPQSVFENDPSSTENVSVRGVIRTIVDFVHASFRNMFY